MRLKLVAYAFGLAVLGDIAYSDPIRVRTGDHANFARIVLDLDGGNNWRVEETETGYLIDPGQSDPFNLEGFFDLIDRTRILAVTEIDEPRGLAIEVACDCHAVSFLDDTGWLVVDVVDGPAPVADPELLPAPVFSDLPSFDTGPIETFQSQNTVLQGLRLPSPVETSAAAPEERPFLPTVPLAQLSEQDAQVNALEAAIRASLGRAVSQGLVVLDQNAPPEATSMELDPDATLEDLLRDVSELHSPGVNISTSIDAARRFPGQSEPGAMPNVTCIPDDMVSVQDWGDGRSFAEQIGELRSAVTGEFDRTDPDSVEALSRGYLFFGFGLEAINALEIDQVLSRERSILIALARVLDGETVELPGFARQMGCPGHSALWGLLAHTEGAFPDSVDAAQVARTFRTLPEHLQLHLGPRLSSKMRKLGADSTAGVILAGIEDAPDAGVELTLAQTEQSLVLGNTGQATSTLEEIADSSPRLTPEALTRLISLKISQLEPVAPEHVELLDIMLFENAENELVAELAVTKLQLQSYQGFFDDAHRTWLEYGPQMTSADASRTRELVVRNTTERADDLVFLSTFFDYDLRSEVAETQNAMARRLLSLGFAEQAAELVQEPVLGAAMSERRYIQAEAALSRGDRARVEDHLAGVDSVRAQALRAGIPLSAEVLGSSALSDEAVGWRTEDWANLAETNDSLLRDVSRRALSRTEPISLSSQPLAASTELLNEAIDLRSTAEELLDRLPVTDQNSEEQGF